MHKKIFTKIEFWLFLFFLLRMIGITNPPLEAGHNWRQTTGLMVARNFLECNANILYPRTDVTDDGNGIIGMEFPLLNYIHFIIAKVFGYQHWYGRLINLIITTIGIYFYYLLFKKLFYKKIAFYATIILSVSIWFSFSRKMMPDTFSISLVLIALYYAIKFLEQKKIQQLVLFAFLSTLGVLSKIPAGIYFALIIPIVYYSKYNKAAKVYLLISMSISLIITFWWYFIWNPHLAQLGHTWYNSGKAINQGAIELFTNLGLVFEHFYFHAFYSYILFSLFTAGTILSIKNKQTKLLSIFILMTSIFIIYMLKSGYYFYHHNYYIIPFVPIMALMAGYALSLIKKQYLIILILSLGTIEGIANQSHDFFINPNQIYKLQFENAADSLTLTNDLIAINGGENPQLIYLSHRKGWTCSNKMLSDSTFLTKISEKGCKYLFINQHNKLNIKSYPIIFKSKDLYIYRLND